VSLFGGLRRTARVEPETRNLSYQDIWGADLQGIGAATYSGTNVTQISSLRMVAVWACVSLIADAISSLELELYSEWGGIKKELSSPAWLISPNIEMTFADCWHRVMASLLLDGNAYLYVGRNANATISTITPVHPSHVSIYRGPDQKLVYMVSGEKLTSDDILHIPAFTVPGSLTGISPIESARQAVGLGLTSEEFGARFFGQGATMSGVIQIPGEMTPEQAQVMAKSFGAAHSGTRKSHLPGVISGGGVWQALSVTPEQSQFLETRRFQKQEIANLYRVPPYMLDPTVSSTWGTGITEQNRAFVTHTLQPWLVRVEQAISRLFPKGQYVKFNLDGLLRGQITERYQAYQIGLAAGFLTIAEVRELEDLSELDSPEPDDENIPAEGPPESPLYTNRPTGS
jgi:HK97 family phage portal protein